MTTRMFQGKYCPSGAPLRIETDIIYKIVETSIDIILKLNKISPSDSPDVDIGAACLTPTKQKECCDCRFNRGFYVSLESVDQAKAI